MVKSAHGLVFMYGVYNHTPPHLLLSSDVYLYHHSHLSLTETLEVKAAQTLQFKWSLSSLDSHGKHLKMSPFQSDPEHQLTTRVTIGARRHLTIRWKGSCVSEALSSSSQYSSSSHILCRVLSGSFSCTGIFTLERSLPMLFLRMFHRLMLMFGLGTGRQDLR